MITVLNQAVEATVRLDIEGPTETMTKPYGRRAFAIRRATFVLDALTGTVRWTGAGGPQVLKSGGESASAWITAEAFDLRDEAIPLPLLDAALTALGEMVGRVVRPNLTAVAEVPS